MRSFDLLLPLSNLCIPIAYIFIGPLINPLKDKVGLTDGEIQFLNTV